MKRLLALLALTARLYGQTAAALTAPPDLQFFDASGRPLASGAVYTNAAGTNTPQATYADYTGTTPNPNPIILNAAGKPPNGIWLNAQQFKFIIKNSAGTTIRTMDYVSDIGLILKTNLAGPTGANLIGYTPVETVQPTTVGGFLDAQGFILDTERYSPNSFAGACAAALAAQKTLAVTSQWVIPAGNYDCDKWFLAEGRLVALSGTVVLGGSFTCPSTQQCLDSTTHGGSAFTFTNLPPFIFPDWWGSKQDGSDSAPGFNAAGVAAGQIPNGGKIGINPGDYTFATGWVVTGTRDLEIAGSGGLSRLLWTGNNSTPLLQLRGTSGTHIHDLSGYFTATHPLIEMINLYEPLSTATPSTRASIHNIFIDTDHVANTLTYGILVSGGQDVNNDFHHFEDLKFYGFTKAGVEMRGSQSYANLFVNCTFGELAGEQYGIRAVSTTGGPGGGGAASFQAVGGFFGTILADVYVDGYSDHPIQIIGTDSESTGRILKVVNAAQGVVSLKGISWRNGAAGTLITDFINCQCSALDIEDSYFSSFLSGSGLGAFQIIYNNDGPLNSINGLTMKNVHILATTAYQTLNGLFNPVGSGSGGSDVNLQSWLTYTNVFWQDATTMMSSGLYGLTNNFLASPSSLTISNTTNGSVTSGTYTSGGSISGTVSQTCSVTGFNNSSTATATVALTGSNTIDSGTALGMLIAGTGATSPPTSATLGNGTATCSGTAVITTVLGTTMGSFGAATSFVTDNVAANTIYTGTEGCLTNQTPIVIRAGSSDSSTYISTVTGHIIMGGASTQLLQASVAYSFLCTGDDTAANSFLFLLQNGGR